MAVRLRGTSPRRAAMGRIARRARRARRSERWRRRWADARMVLRAWRRRLRVVVARAELERKLALAARVMLALAALVGRVALGLGRLALAPPA